jgi:exodeoxyribonuclease VII small subunit
MGEVEEILADLETGNVDIDTLGREVARAVELITLCRQKLEKTEAEVKGLVAGLEEPETAAGGNDDGEPSAQSDEEDLPF